MIFANFMQEKVVFTIHYVSDGFQDKVVPPDMENEDVAEFCSAIELNNESFPWDALNHLYLTKYLLHMNMEKLIFLNDEFLDNRDCTSIIGEFLRIKKEWLIYTKDWYRHQALQILYTLAKGDATSKLFSDIDEAPFVVSREIEAAKRIGMLQFKEIGFKCNCCSDIGQYLAWKAEEHPAALKTKLQSWLQTQEYCESDLDYYLMSGIEPIFKIAIKRLDEISGCNVIEDTWINLNGDFEIYHSRVTLFAVQIMQIEDVPRQFCFA